MNETASPVRFLVCFASRHGATAGIAEAIGVAIREAGAEATVAEAGAAPDPGGFDAVVLGSAIYFGGWLEAAEEYANAHAESLKERPVWIFSSGPLGEPDNLLPEGEPERAAPFRELTGAREHRVFAGRLDKSVLKLREKMMVSALRAPEGDFRDWEAIAAFGREVAGSLSA
jgi:menaquinone-dependent protoporphyrinogen oxidase